MGDLQRRLYGVVGVGLVLLVGGFLGARGFGHPENGPAVEIQAVVVAVVGILFVVAAVPWSPTDAVPWYRLTGLGNVLLGIVVPLGFVTGGVFGGATTASTVVGILAGLSLAVVGADQLVFGGRHADPVPPESGPPDGESSDGGPPG